MSGNLSIVVFSSGCYFIEKSTGMWSTDGLEILPDSNLTHVHCISSHLTDFAGCFIVLPNPIDFDSVFANSAFEKNPTVYAVVISLGFLYILSAVVLYFVDKQDILKAKIHIMADNHPNYGYLYEIIIFTGNRKG